MRKQLPPRDLVWIDAQGKPTEIFFEFVKNLDSRSLGAPVNVADTPADTETIVYNATTGQFDYGAN